MCGRISLYRNTKEVAERFEVEQLELELEEHYNLFPSSPVPVILQGEKRRLTEFKWGLVPWWAVKFGKEWKPRTHARMETLGEKMFAEPFKLRRGLIPLNGYFEFKKSRGTPSIPHYFYRTDQSLFSVAALWEEAKTPEGVLNSFAIVTCPSNAIQANVHSRMPVILDGRDEEDRWLDPANKNVDELADLLTVLPAEKMAGHRAPATVNNARFDTADLIEPAGELP